MCINFSNNIKLSVNSNTRGNMYKLYKCNFCFGCKKVFFFSIELLMHGILCLIVLFFVRRNRHSIIN